MSKSNYIGNNGLVTQNLEEIIQELEDGFKSIYGNNINVEQNSPDGQLINLLAQQKIDVLDLITQYYNNLDVDSVVGFPQQVLYKLNGLKIKAYTYSYVEVDVTVNSDITLKGLDADLENENGVGYTVTDINGNNWILTETSVLTPGVNTLNFRAEELGQITSLANTITIMNTVEPGVVSVNNPSNNYITGGQGETPAEFKIRRNQSMQAPSQGFDESIKGQILALTNVKQCKVYSNRSNQEENGIPAHTLWVIVQGGTSEDIGNVIYNNIPPGIPMMGSETVNVTRPDGTVDTINYDLAKPVELYIKATISTMGADAPIIDLDYVKSQLAVNTFTIGEVVDGATITTLIKNILGDTGSVYGVEVSLTGADGSYVEILKPSGLDEYFSLSVDNMEFDTAQWT